VCWEILDFQNVFKVNVTSIIMGKLKPSPSPRGRISSQVQTATRTGRVRQQSVRTTVATRKKIKKQRTWWAW